MQNTDMTHEQPREKTPTQEQQPLISLIIPVYQVEKYIAECLESVLAQTFPHLEIICVDDRGTDGSVAIIEEYARKDKRIKLISNARNSGLAASRNAGMQHSSAPYVMFLDSDDTYAPTMCEKMCHAIVSSGADIAACGMQITYEADSALKASDDEYYAVKFKGVHEVNDHIISACDVSACNKIHRRKIIDTYGVRFPDGMKYEDAYFFNAYMAHARSIAFVNERLYQYRRRAGSIMNQTFAKAGSMSVDHLKIAFLLHEHFRKWNLLERKYAYFCRFFLNYLDLALHHSATQQERDEMMCLAGDFARKNLQDLPNIEQKSAERIEYIKSHFPIESKGVIWRVKTKPYSKLYSFLGIPLLRIRYTPTIKKYYLFGIIFRRKKHVE